MKKKIDKKIFLFLKKILSIKKLRWETRIDSSKINIL